MYENWEPLDLDQVPWLAIQLHTVLCGHSEEPEHDPFSCAASVLSDVSHNPVRDVNIGQNGQHPLLVLNGLNPPLVVPTDSQELVVNALHTCFNLLYLL